MIPPDRLPDAFRRWGYLQADLDPLGRLEPLVHPDLEGAEGKAAQPWRRLYCGSIGAEFMHIHILERAAWVAERMETEPPATDTRRILRRLAEAELLERFLHQRWVGSKRYSLEGSAALIPLLDALLDASAAHGADTALLAMSHRGRLNVMINVAGRPARDLFTHFEDGDPRSVLGGGDLRYHLGATGVHTTPSGEEVQVHLVSNPSHLEAVGPVMMGRARARQDRVGSDGVRRVVPVALHGDAALAGQGITAETFNLDGLAGFGVGGTLHVVVNNLIGFTTPPAALHASRYATDVAKRLPIPIFHVNGFDPEAVVRAAVMAADYRARFGTDVVVDLVGFRRYGHSEVDDPTITQPLLYRRIEALPPLWQDYGRRTGATDQELAALEEEITDGLQAAREEAEGRTAMPEFRTLPQYWAPYQGGPYSPELEVETGVAPDRLAEIAAGLASVPEGFNVHEKVARGLTRRREMGRGERPVDWGMAEALALGSLLWEGVPVRLVGEDSRRGTFNQRHAVLFDVEDGREHVPLAHLHPDQAPVAIHDTILSEAAALAFEYGWSRDTPEALVCWEAQFGDFVNGAQVILDQFVSAAEDKWGLLSGLVLLLPHGYEGQGPEHSSARLERFLQLAAEDNMQVTQPSTAAQLFHLLRRQALRRWRKPLVVLTPKGMLRSAAAASSLEDLSKGRFQTIRGDLAPGEAHRVLICSGKLVHELRERREERPDAPSTAIVSLEQLYPFPEEEVAAALEAHSAAVEIVWVQEEPANMGARAYVRPRLQRLAGDRHVTTVQRSASASPATGSLAAHKVEQEALLELAFAHPH